jgi:hypothetical protein
MGTRKYRFDPATGDRAPISTTRHERDQAPHPMPGRATWLLFIVMVLAAAATVLRM